MFGIRNRDFDRGGDFQPQVRTPPPGISNPILEEEISKLKTLHINEFNALIDANQMKIKLVAEKTKIIMDKFDAFKKAHQNYIFSSDISLFESQYKAICKYGFNDLKTYPKYSDVTENRSFSTRMKWVFHLERLLHSKKLSPPQLKGCWKAKLFLIRKSKKNFPL